MAAENAAPAPMSTSDFRAAVEATEAVAGAGPRVLPRFEDVVQKFLDTSPSGALTEGDARWLMARVYDGDAPGAWIDPCHLGHCLRAIGDGSGAIHLWEKALGAVDPQHREALVRENAIPGHYPTLKKLLTQMAPAAAATAAPGSDSDGGLEPGEQVSRARKALEAAYAASERMWWALMATLTAGCGSSPAEMDDWWSRSQSSLKAYSASLTTISQAAEDFRSYAIEDEAVIRSCEVASRVSRAKTHYDAMSSAAESAYVSRLNLSKMIYEPWRDLDRAAIALVDADSSINALVASIEAKLLSAEDQRQIIRYIKGDCSGAVGSTIIRKMDGKSLSGDRSAYLAAKSAYIAAVCAAVHSETFVSGVHQDLMAAKEALVRFDYERKSGGEALDHRALEALLFDH